jgi:hypothetical protein
MPRVAVSSLFLLVVATGCGSTGGVTSENYGNLLASPQGLILVQEEHPTGWGRAECFGCHEIFNIHTINRTGLPDAEVDLPGVRAIVFNQGLASCPQCHGNNGVIP